MPNIIRQIIGGLLPIAQEDVLMTHTVEEFLWGYKDPLLHTLHTRVPDLFQVDVVSVFNASVSALGHKIHPRLT